MQIREIRGNKKVYLRGIKQETIIIMRKTTLILAFLAVVAYGGAQEFLTPVSYGIYDYFENGNETMYQLLVAGEKINENSASWTAQFSTYFLCAPSFSPEYALVVGNNQLILNKAKANIWYYLTANAYIQAPDFNKRDKEQRKQIRHLANSMKSDLVNSFTMDISKEQSECIAALFKHATQTATHLQCLSLGIDGTTYYFNHSGKLASVWMPSEGRTAQLVGIALKLCYAVVHQDTTVLNQQMEACRALTKEFKQEYPDRYFQPSWVSRSSGDKGPWHCELSGDNCMELEVLFDTAISDITAQSVSDLYTDSLASWSREYFLTSDNPRYPSVVIDNHADSAICLATQNERYVWRKITIPETLWRRKVILTAAQLPPGRYYFAEGEWREQ